MRARREDEGGVHEQRTLLDEIAGDLEAPPEISRLPEPLVAHVVDGVHPTLTGRVLVRWEAPGASGVHERWLPTLHGLAVRAGDRVLVSRPGNWPEAIVIGVIDGFAKRPDVPRSEGASLSLHRDEALRVTGVDGAPLVEIFQSDAGPVVRLLGADVDLELPGNLRVNAKQIELNATAGGVKITASDDVTVEAESIHLN